MSLLYKAGFFLLSLPFFASAESEEDLFKESMLYQASEAVSDYSNKTKDWLLPSQPQPKKALEEASVWLKISPKKLITPMQQSTLSFLARRDIWEMFQEIGIQGIDIGPLQLTGELYQGEFKNPTPDLFAPISLQIDPLFGTSQDLQKMMETLRAYQGTWIASLDAETTGFGADFWLALKNEQKYPYLYLMKPIEEKDWKFLPEVSQGSISAHLNVKDLENLHKKGYLSEDKIYTEPLQKKTMVDVSPPVMGADGKKRRWIYLHPFDSSSPLLNPMHPSFTSQKMLAGTLFTLLSQGSKMVKILPFTHKVFPPLVEELASLARSRGSYLLQDTSEANISPLQSTDLTYEYAEKKGIQEALWEYKTELLRTYFESLLSHGTAASSFIHSLGSMEKDLSLIEWIAKALHISLSSVGEKEKEKLKQVHLLLVALTAWQPGAFVMDAEDLVGRYGSGVSYDLMGDLSKVSVSRFGVPKGNVLYGPLLRQKDGSFALACKAILKVRKNYQIATADLIQVPLSEHPSLLCLVHRLPSTHYLQLTALNFSPEPLQEEIEIDGIEHSSAINLMTRKAEAKDFSSNRMVLELKGYEGKAILFQPRTR